jgi:S-adenosylmethionine:tRNA ribosyltransferase-isomerase
MIAAADRPIQRPPDAKLLAIDARRNVRHVLRRSLVEFLRDGDLVIANDAATLPASLSGEHLQSGRLIEVRLAGRDSLATNEIRHWMAVVFGAGDFRMRTEDRPQPPELATGDEFVLGPLHATVERILGHPRLVRLVFDGSSKEILEGLAHHGRPIQYSHVKTPLALWDVWTPIAGPPVAFEPPSAGFVLDWRTLSSLKERGVRFATITHASGISSTGDPELDALLPFDEPYSIPPYTVLSVHDAQAQNGRIIAVGTTVARALEAAAGLDGSVRAGEGVATQRIGSGSRLRVVDAMLSGTHEPDTSHHELLRAFLDDETLAEMDWELNLRGYRTHEFGDSVFVKRIEHPHVTSDGLR